MMARAIHVTMIALAWLALAPAALSQEPNRPRRGRGGPPPNPRVMEVLDTDSDGSLSAAELAAAAGALLTIDADGDGNLTVEELNPDSNQRGFGGPGGMPRMMRPLPVMTALDLDGDGELFEDEVSEASVLLLALDRDGDGTLSREELAPVGFGRSGPGGPGGPGRDVRGRGAARGPAPRPETLDRNDAVANIPDRATFKELSYQGSEVMIDTHLSGLEFVKFQIEGAGTDDPLLYFMNTKTHRSHPGFMGTIGIGIGGEGQMRGVLVYWPMLKSPAGSPGLYTFEFEPNDAYPLEMIRIARDLLAEHSALLRGHLAYNLLPRARERYERERDLWDASDIDQFEEGDRFGEIAYLPLHLAESYGRLRLMTLEERPGQRDVVIYPTLPNEMPRVAGVITGVQQTPLSHVNLRAVQDDVPNAFVANVLEDETITGLIGKLVYYRVGSDGFILREATPDEYESYYAALRPEQPQVPIRDLSVKRIRPFSEITFADARNVGVKAANLAALRRLGLGDTLTPDGFAIPFHFYDAFMQHNGFYELAAQLEHSTPLHRDAEAREAALSEFRTKIESGSMPPWMLDALAEVQRAFPDGTSIRCRSSTNNEDLPGFTGAGLYDSYTHRPNEGHLEKSIKQVYASLWNFRAYEEREFYRIDHSNVAMAVVLHPNTSNELANGVAVSRDILYQTYEQLGVRYYVNAQVGEDLVTNPGPQSIPEELLLSPRNPRTDKVLRRSSLSEAGQAVLGDRHLAELRRSLRTIDKQFRVLYDVAPNQAFAVEVEFKVTEGGDLFIKQVRPWAF